MAKDKPYYPFKSIASIDSLAKTLGVIPGLLTDLAKDTSSSYIKFQINTKGKDRDVYEPKYELKRLQKRINSRIFEKVEFPPYLQGGIRDVVSPRDYIENSRFHAGSKFLISLDIKDFYHSIREQSVLDVFANFFCFPPVVSNLLTRLVMLDGKVPQGACTSSYVANLIFYNNEYSLVSKLKSRGYIYTRLLDDITISSDKNIDQQEATELIKGVAGLVRRHGLRLKTSKTKLERSDDINAKYAVTGVWVGHGVPKLRKQERRYVRQLVYVCEKAYEANPYCDDYHKLWNRVSGQVAKLTRLCHPQAAALRQRMGCILPLYDEQMRHTIYAEANKLLRKPMASHSRVGVISSYRRIIYSLGILSRTDRRMSRTLRCKLKARFIDLPTKAEMWE